MTILDAHMHAWDAGRLRMAWASGLPGFAARGFEAYRAAFAGTGIAGAIIFEADVAAEQRRAEAEDFAARCARGEAAAAVPCLDPRDALFTADARAVATVPSVRGLRWIARTAADADALAASPRAREGFAALADLGLLFELNLPATSLARAADIAACAPRTRFVLDHCGNPDPLAFARAPSRAPRHDADAWRRGIDRVAALPNVGCKISGVVSPLAPRTWCADDLAPVVDRCLDAFGPGRALFGTDWPVCTLAGTLAEWVDAAHHIAARRPERERAELFGDAARRWYRIG